MTPEEKMYTGIQRFYFNRTINAIIEIGDLENENMILDIGCGSGQLKSRLKHRVINYDSNPDYTGVKTYTRLNPTAIVCSHVLEHMNRGEIILMMRTLSSRNPSAKLITAIPTENMASRIGMIITNTPDAHSGHKTDLKQITAILNEFCNLLEQRNILTMSQVSLWKFKAKDR